LIFKNREINKIKSTRRALNPQNLDFEATCPIECAKKTAETAFKYLLSRVSDQSEFTISLPPIY